MIGSIEEAAELISLSGEDFSFYPFERIEQYHNIGVIGFLDEEMIFSSIDYDAIHTKLKTVVRGSKHYILRNIGYEINRAVAASKCNDAEVILLTRPSKNDTCSLWHIDKPNLRINIENATHFNVSNMKFLLPIFGESTQYVVPTTVQRDRFLAISNETTFFIGPTQTCDVNTSIQSVFAKSLQYQSPDGHAVVHSISNNMGAIHSAPMRSISGRILILITPFNITF